jgi:hypothetical protein
MELNKSEENTNTGSEKKAETGKQGWRPFGAALLGSVVGKLVTSDWLRNEWKWITDRLVSVFE